MAGQVSSIRGTHSSKTIAVSGYPSQHSTGNIERALNSTCVTAYSVEFVAKPGEASNAQAALAGAITSTLKEVMGFAGCMVMTSDQEARLMTVVTFWRGSDRVKHCNANTRWVNALVAPYMDRKLRSQTMVAQLPLTSLAEVASNNSADARAAETLSEPEEEACVA